MADNPITTLSLALSQIQANLYPPYSTDKVSSGVPLTPYENDFQNSLQIIYTSVSADTSSLPAEQAIFTYIKNNFATTPGIEFLSTSLNTPSLKAGYSTSDIMQALFPSGRITTIPYLYGGLTSWINYFEMIAVLPNTDLSKKVDLLNTNVMDSTNPSSIFSIQAGLVTETDTLKHNIDFFDTNVLATTNPSSMFNIQAGLVTETDTLKHNIDFFNTNVLATTNPSSIFNIQAGLVSEISTLQHKIDLFNTNVLDTTNPSSMFNIQASLVTEIQDLQDNYTPLSAKVTDLGSKQTSLGSAIATLQDNYTPLSAKVDDLSSSVDLLASEYSTLSSTVAKLSAVPDLSSELAALKLQFESFEAKTIANEQCEAQHDLVNMIFHSGISTIAVVGGAVAMHYALPVAAVIGVGVVSVLALEAAWDLAIDPLFC